MSQQEADQYMIGYFERTAKEEEERADLLERLYPFLSHREEAAFMKAEAKGLREHVARLREAAKEWPQG